MYQEWAKSNILYGDGLKIDTMEDPSAIAAAIDNGRKVIKVHTQYGGINETVYLVTRHIIRIVPEENMKVRG